MPAGVTNGVYIKCLLVGIVSMVAGSSLVHSYYQPLSDLEDYVQREIESRKNESSQINDSLK